MKRVKETVAIILCSFQGEDFIAEQLDSLITQTYDPIEIYVFDDCSTDSTIDIVEQYSGKYKNISLNKNDQNLGYLKNFENAINTVKADYIALCDQDDIWHPDKIKISMLEMKALEGTAPNIPALVHTDLLLIDKLSNIIASSFFDKKEIRLPPKKSVNLILGQCGIMGNSILMNSQLVKKALPFPSGLKYHDYWLALVNELYGVRKTINKSLVKYRIHQNNFSNNKKFIDIDNKSLNWLNRDFPLPFMEDKRELAIRFLLDNYCLDFDDKKLITRFYDYLIFDGNRFLHFFFLYNNDMLKKNVLYRFSVFFRIMFTKRYN